MRRRRQSLVRYGINNVYIYVNFYICIRVAIVLVFWKETRRGSPVYNRPSPDKLHHFVKKKNVTCDT